MSIPRVTMMLTQNRRSKLHTCTAK